MGTGPLRWRHANGVRLARRRLLGWLAVIAAWASMTVAGCANRSPAASPSAGSTVVTCPGSPAACTSPGTVRWPLRLPGSVYAINA
jgi:hypothetical protein